MINVVFLYRKKKLSKSDRIKNSRNNSSLQPKLTLRIKTKSMVDAADDTNF
jgi:hypothetical protein